MVRMGMSHPGWDPLSDPYLPWWGAAGVTIGPCSAVLYISLIIGRTTRHWVRRMYGYNL